MQAFVVGHRGVHVGGPHAQPFADADVPLRRERHVLVGAEPDLRPVDAGVAVVHAQCFQPAIGHGELLRHREDRGQKRKRRAKRQPEYRFHLAKALPLRQAPAQLPWLGTFRWTRQQVYGRADWDLVEDPPSYESRLKSTAYFGTPEHVVERIQDLRDEHNVQYYTAHFSYGSMEHDKVMRTMKLFAEEVMPKFR